jgi:hypothetical protein
LRARSASASSSTRRAPVSNATERLPRALDARRAEVRVAAIRSVLSREEQLQWRQLLDTNPPAAIAIAEAVLESYIRLLGRPAQLALDVAA